MRIQALLITGILMLAVAFPAMGQSKFKNKDTAKDRQDYRWGTRKTDENSTGYHGVDEKGNASWGNKITTDENGPSTPEQPIIIVNPDVKYGNQTATTTTRDAAGNVTGSTTTTTTN